MPAGAGGEGGVADVSPCANDAGVPCPVYAPSPRPCPSVRAVTRYRPRLVATSPSVWSRLRVTLAAVAALAAVVSPGVPLAGAASVAVDGAVGQVRPAQPGVSGLGVRVAASLEALAERVVQERPRVVLPRSGELAAIPAAGRAGRVLGAAIMLTDSTQRPPPPAPPSVRDASVTGAALAVGAQDASREGGSGLASAGSGGQSAAIVSRIDPLAVHAGFQISLPERRTVPIHTSILPLERPG